MKPYNNFNLKNIPPKQQSLVPIIDVRFTSQFIAVHLCVDSKTSDTVLSSNTMEANNLTFCCVSGRGDASKDHIRRCTT